MPDTDLVLRQPATGEILLKDAPLDQLAAAIDLSKDMRRQLAEFEQEIGDVVIDRMDQEGLHTLHIPGWKVTGDAPGVSVNYDAERLWYALLPFVDDGTITEGALGRAVERAYTYKAKARGLTSLAKLGGRVADAILGARDETPRTNRRVSVKRES